MSRKPPRQRPSAGGNTPAQASDSEAELEQQIKAAFSGIQSGSIEILVHESRIVQIQRRFNLDNSSDQTQSA